MLSHLSLAGLLLAVTLPTSPASATANNAREQLAAASKIRRDANKKDPEEKRRILLQSVASYQEVLERFTDDPVACAEAAYRVGEIQRSLGDAPAARQAFEHSATLGAHEPRFAARACNELGHLARRAGDAEGAIRQYQRVMGEFAAQEPEGAAALTWIGKVEASRNRDAEASAAWLSVAERFPSQPIAAIRAADLAALAALARGDRAAATKIVDETRARFSADNPDQEFWSPKVDEAVARMKAPTRLAAPALDNDDAADADVDDDG